MDQMIKIPELVYVIGDWECLYGNGDLLYQDNVLSAKRVLKILGVPTQYRGVTLPQEEQFPNKLSKIGDIEQRYKLRRAKELRDRAVELEEEAAKLEI